MGIGVLSLPLIPRTLLALVLAAAAVSKLAARGRSADALGDLAGIRGRRGRAALVLGLVLWELVLAGGLAAGAVVAAFAAGITLLVFAAALLLLLRGGRGGAPCACFGARSRVSPASALRAALLGAACLALPWLPDPRPSGDGWLLGALGLAIIVIAALVVAVLALLREVGELRLALRPAGALEIADEGPEFGSRSSLIERFAPAGEARFALAVFSSPGCPMCVALEPAVAALGAHPLVSLRVFDEHTDADAWQAADVPGSPYAVAMAADGTVLAKGTFNTAAQLESVLAAAERREPEAALG